MAENAVNYELVIVGAGIAGLNALHSASCYLKPTDKVMLVDPRAAAGGMWRDTYDFVRLHQPHAMFTAGNIPWKRTFEPSYLADKTEVLEQMDHCFDILKARVDLDARFGHRYAGHREQDGTVDVDIEAVDGAQKITVKTRRLIKAFGYDVTPKQPLQLSSSCVNSISPNQEEFFADRFTKGAEPVFVVGGGKTGMDTAHYICTHMPKRPLHMITGQGVMFAEREKQFPKGFRRWFRGWPGMSVFVKMTQYFNGENLEDTNRFRLRELGLSLSDNPKQFQFGFLSLTEMTTVKAGVTSVIESYLEDIVDHEDGAQIRLRNGKQIDIPAGSWVVNCSGYIGREMVADEPYVSPSGNVLSINQSSLPFFLTTFAGYFLTHLMFLDKLLEVPLYAANFPKISRIDKSAMGTISETITLLNVLQLMRAVPTQIFNECGLDISRWYPFVRRIPIMSKLMLRGDRYAAHCRQALDRFAKDHDVTIGPLPHVAQGAAR